MYKVYAILSNITVTDQLMTALLEGVNVSSLNQQATQDRNTQIWCTHDIWMFVHAFEKPLDHKSLHLILSDTANCRPVNLKQFELVLGHL